MKKPRSTKTLFLVELVLPPGMSQTNMCYNIADAIKSEVGHHHPQEPMFNLDRDTVKVKSAGPVLRGIKNAIEELRARQQDAKPIRGKAKMANFSPETLAALKETMK